MDALQKAVNEAVDAAEEDMFELWADRLAKAHVHLFGKPLDMGDGETTEETVGGTVQRFVESVEEQRDQLSEALTILAKAQGLPKKCHRARLIAAAPDLLAACKALLAATHDCGYDCRQGDVMDAQKFAEAAIAKAQGK